MKKGLYISLKRYNFLRKFADVFAVTVLLLFTYLISLFPVYYINYIAEIPEVLGLQRGVASLITVTSGKEEYVATELSVSSPAKIIALEKISSPEEDDPVDIGYNNRWGITDIADEERLLLAQVVYAEGHNTGLEGCAKIVVTVFNRFLNGGFFAGGSPTITSVLTAADQFSVYPGCVNITPTDQEYLAIEMVLNGTVSDDIYNGSWLYFYGDGRQNHFR